MWIDSHAHLYDLCTEEVGIELELAKQAGVELILNCGTSTSTSQIVLDQCIRFPNHIRGAVGISPFDVADLPSSWVDSIENLARSPGIIALGEIGLDQSNPRYPALSDQLPVLEQQLHIARELQKPVLLHSRGAESLLVDILREHRIRKALFHCFTGDALSLERIVHAGYDVSFSGIITFKNSPVSHLLPHIPLQRLHIETDSPYLAPIPHRGKRNHPAWVALTGEYIAASLNMHPDALALILRSNFLTLFGEEAMSCESLEGR